MSFFVLAVVDRALNILHLMGEVCLVLIHHRNMRRGDREEQRRLMGEAERRVDAVDSTPMEIVVESSAPAPPLPSPS